MSKITVKSTRTARASKIETPVKRVRNAKTVEELPVKRARKNAEPVKQTKSAKRVSKNVELIPFREGSVRANIVEMLSTKRGATIEAICDATGWSEATIRARIGGLKSRGYAIENIGERGTATYRIS